MSEINWGSISEGLRLSATFDTYKTLVGRPVNLNIVLENVSDKEIVVVSRSRWTDYRLDLRDSENNKVELTAFGKNVAERAGITRRIKMKLAARQTIVDQILLNQLFDMSICQKYELTVAKDIYKLDSEGFSVVTSNQVEVLIDESEPSIGCVGG
jgi:hypothetical protein